jgi:hemolysin-activating ACP:hemolysin acyltransferase
VVGIAVTITCFLLYVSETLVALSKQSFRPEQSFVAIAINYLLNTIKIKQGNLFQNPESNSNFICCVTGFIHNKDYYRSLKQKRSARLIFFALYINTCNHLYTG